METAKGLSKPNGRNRHIAAFHSTGQSKDRQQQYKLLQEKRRERTKCVREVLLKGKKSFRIAEEIGCGRGNSD
jgi:hypothetical protein